MYCLDDADDDDTFDAQFLQSFLFIRVKLHLRDEEQTDRRTKRHVSLFVRLSVVSVRGVHHNGERSAMLHRNLRGK